MGHGAFLDLRNHQGYTASDLAARFHHDDVVKAIEADVLRRRDHGFKRLRRRVSNFKIRAVLMDTVV